MDILEKREIDEMNLFYEHINLKACPTSFAIASGLISFADENNMLCSSYFINDTSEMNYKEVLIVDNTGNIRNLHKLDRFLPGIRMGMRENELEEDLINGSIRVNGDISVIEYGYFPKSRLDSVKNKIDTGIKIKLPTLKYTYGEPKYTDFTVYKDDDTYFIEYPVYSMNTIENKGFLPGANGLFKIEPVRFWKDESSGLLISQDVIMGGIPYKAIEEEINYEYDDYYESDLYKAVNNIEENMKILNNLVKSSEKGKKR